TTRLPRVSWPGSAGGPSGWKFEYAKGAC
ncbi:uncharacterized protein METZ01_LOCUS489680, partial [marine metagenome]